MLKSQFVIMDFRKTVINVVKFLLKKIENYFFTYVKNYIEKL